jgi:hypothetical protein
MMFGHTNPKRQRGALRSLPLPRWRFGLVSSVFCSARTASNAMLCGATKGFTMLTIPGAPLRTCEGITRRDWLRVGALGSFGLGLPALLAGRSRADDSRSTPSHSFGRAKSCIVLFMFGAPSHLDIWDLKPHAPAETRGEFQPIATSVPGIQVCEHVPRLAKMADRYALLRSVTHPDNTHTVAMHYMLTGVRHARPATNPQNAPDDFPCFGAVMNYLQDARVGGRVEKARTASAALPPGISLNAPANQVSANNHIFPGFFAGFLGSRYDPLFVPQNANAKDFRPVPAAAAGERLPRQRMLLDEVERQTKRLVNVAEVQVVDRYYAKAFDLLTSPAARKAFDLSQERPALREKYGDTPFGQGCLLARRLVEAGVRLVTVNWERDDAYWDTHQNNFADHKNKLLPNLDRGFSALLDDLGERGLLEDTLIVWLGEFGRTPAINKNAGRDHWAPCNTVLLAGAGIRGGMAYGASDRTAAYPARQPVTPEDIAATLYHLLGIDRQLTLSGPLGRPLALCDGEPVWGVM